MTLAVELEVVLSTDLMSTDLMSHDDDNDDYDDANDDATGNASLWFRSIRINW